MRTIEREQALNLLSAIEIISYSKEDIELILFGDYLDEQGNSKIYESIYSPEVQTFLIEFIKNYRNLGVTNNYLTEILTNCGFHNFVINGEAPILEKCACCGYRTLVKRTPWSICKVCFWEDDGSDIESDNSIAPYIGSNLKEARKNFLEIGACSKTAKQFVDPSGKEKFAKG